MRNKIKGLLFGLLAVCVVFAVPMQAQAADKTDYSAVFDANYYYSAYADLQSAIGNDGNALLKHFITYGMQEGRQGSSEFDVMTYMANYPDLVQVFGLEDYKSYYLHYISYGKKEGRIAVSTGSALSASANKNAAVPETILISSYTTAFDPSESRAVNIALSASRINGMVIQPGQKFSFSDSIGPRTAANGYVIAPTFVNRETVPGMGGGICQVSSTMYAAMLEGGIKATQRYAHSKPVTYIPEGMDATIVAGKKDLTFTNNFEYPIIINAVVDGGTVTVSFSK